MGTFVMMCVFFVAFAFYAVVENVFLGDQK